MRRLAQMAWANFAHLLAIGESSESSRLISVDASLLGPVEPTGVRHVRPRRYGNKVKYTDRSKYMPHQGEQEKARRKRKMEANQ